MMAFWATLKWCHQIWLKYSGCPEIKPERTPPALNGVPAPPAQPDLTPSVLVCAASEKSLGTSQSWGISKTSRTLKDRPCAAPLSVVTSPARPQQIEGSPGESPGQQHPLGAHVALISTRNLCSPFWDAGTKRSQLSKHTYWVAGGREDKLMKGRKEAGWGSIHQGERAQLPRVKRSKGLTRRSRSGTFQRSPSHVHAGG